MTTIVKATSKGQVTLPSKWRKHFDTDRYLIKENGSTLIITPLDVDKLEDENWEVVFDAKKHNGGKGIPVDEFIRVLKKTL